MRCVVLVKQAIVRITGVNRYFYSSWNVLPEIPTNFGSRLKRYSHRKFGGKIMLTCSLIQNV